MKKIYSYILLFTLLGMGVGVASSFMYSQLQPFEVRREKVISEMNSLILEKTEAGEYGCCIEPACDMCFLGHWLWDDGVCRCDELIAKGEFDKVCPQCKKGIEAGLCKSTQSAVCGIQGNVNLSEGVK